MTKEITLIDLQTKEEVTFDKALRMIIDNETARQSAGMGPQDIDFEIHVRERANYYLSLYDFAEIRNEYQLESALSRDVSGITVRDLIDIMRKIDNLFMTINDPNTEQARALFEKSEMLEEEILKHITLVELTHLEETGLLD